MVEVTALIIGTITTSLIALTVFAKNSKSLTNKLFVGLAASLIGWSLSTYFSLHTGDDRLTLIWMRPIMFFVVLQNTFFFLLVKVFPAVKFNFFQSKKYLAAIIYSAIVASIALSPFLFKDFKDGSPLPGPGMALFIPHALIFAVGGILHLFVRYFRSHGIEKAQLQYFLAGTVLLYTLVPVGNFILPLAFQISLLVTLSPLYSIVFSGLFAYAIVAKRLFDIKAAVARSVAYVLLVGTMAFGYSIVLFGIVNVIFGGQGQETLRQILSVILVFPFALSFQPIRRFFDRLTDRIFYRDSYDSQVVLNRLGRVIVAEIDLHKILHGTQHILADALKMNFVDFLFFKNGMPYLESSTNKVLESHLEKFTKEVSEQKRTVLITDEISPHNPIREILSEADVAVSLHLKTQDETVGYILFGNKKSGDIYSSQDIKLLRIVANELAIAIQNALRFEEIQEFNLTLQEKITQATKNLRQANEKLKQLDQTKDDFISMASHQLRTPLTSVKGYLSMVIEGDAGKINTQQKKLLDQAFVSSQRMVYLIADLLNVSRLRTGKFIIEAKPTNLADVVEGEISQLIETAKGRGLELTYDKPKDFPVLMLDDTKIRQVIMNFADNAIYYTPSGGHIKVSLVEKGESIEFTVADDGMGVPKSEQHHLFNKFYRAGNAKKARPDGTGLGLFMAKKVIVAQGGAIIFNSQEGKGSTFGFSFAKGPLSPAHYKAPSTPPNVKE